MSDETLLKKSLQDFQTRFNESRRVQKLVKKWDRRVFIETTDSPDKYTLDVRMSAVADVLDGPPPDDRVDVVHLQATTDVMIDIFSGAYNPSNAHLDGLLTVFSKERDKVKLEAIALLMWGLSQ